MNKASRDAYRSWIGYSPMHTGYRPKSRWSNADKRAKSQLENAYNLADAKYQLHRIEAHGDSTSPTDVVKYMNIITRNGRLKP